MNCFLYLGFMCINAYVILLNKNFVMGDIVKPRYIFIIRRL